MTFASYDALGTLFSGGDEADSTEPFHGPQIPASEVQSPRGIGRLLDGSLSMLLKAKFFYARVDKLHINKRWLMWGIKHLRLSRHHGPCFFSLRSGVDAFPRDISR